MKLVSAVLRDCQNVTSRVAPIFSRICISQHTDFLYRFLVWRDDCRPSPREAINAGAINLIIVCRDALPIGGNLWLILGLEDGSI